MISRRPAKIIGVASCGPDYEIGEGMDLIYRNPVDMSFFSGITAGKLVVMGRKTFETLPTRSLRGRRICVITTKTAEEIQLPVNGFIATNVDDAYDIASALWVDIAVAGGSEIYTMFEEEYSEFYLTRNKQPHDKTDKTVYMSDSFISMLNSRDHYHEPEPIFVSRQHGFEIQKYTCT